MNLVDIEPPARRRFEHHLVRVRPSAGAVVIRDGRALLIWRHRDRGPRRLQYPYREIAGCGNRGAVGYGRGVRTREPGAPG